MNHYPSNNSSIYIKKCQTMNLLIWLRVNIERYIKNDELLSIRYIIYRIKKMGGHYPSDTSFIIN